MEANGYRTLKELHSRVAVFVEDFIFVSNKLYSSLTRWCHEFDDNLDQDVVDVLS